MRRSVFPPLRPGEPLTIIVENCGAWLKNKNCLAQALRLAEATVHSTLKLSPLFVYKSLLTVTVREYNSLE